MDVGKDESRLYFQEILRYERTRNIVEVNHLKVRHVPDTELLPPNEWYKEPGMERARER